ncbi:MAG: hypothetical protein D6723_06220 [Acidobacteria bacterium]|nr:MAG: hypothetical protein D6723_06220 [Acidobacteriota bacterium]
MIERAWGLSFFERENDGNRPGSESFRYPRRVYSYRCLLTKALRPPIRRRRDRVAVNDGRMSVNEREWRGT